MTGMTTEMLPIEVDEATERRCYRCHEIRPRAMFYEERERRRSIRDGRRDWKMHCRICQREINIARLADRRAQVDAVKIERGCMDCGLKLPDHPEVFDFDHRPGEVKVDGIAVLIHKGTVEEMFAEMEKCDVVCANCHRIRTRQRGRILPGEEIPDE